MTTIITSYIFDPVHKLLSFPETPTFDIRRLYWVINRGEILYNQQDRQDNGHMINDKLYLYHDTTKMSADDPLVVIYESEGGESTSGLTDAELRATPVPMSVSNFPATQPVSGSVSVSNFPATQPVSGPATNAEIRATPLQVMEEMGIALRQLLQFIQNPKYFDTTTGALRVNSHAVTLSSTNVTTVTNITKVQDIDLNRLSWYNLVRARMG